MSVYVDNAKNVLGRMKMCHMVADTNEELQKMAGRIGLNYAWYQEGGFTPHYDLSLSRRKMAVEAGAIEVTSRELVRMIRRKKDE